MTYETFEINGEIQIHQTSDEGVTSVVPVDEANPDYQRYLESIKS